jgi:hypothetical protein
VLQVNPQAGVVPEQEAVAFVGTGQAALLSAVPQLVGSVFALQALPDLW